MGMFGDFFRFFFAVVAGRRDSLVAFTEPLTMAERYLQWGREKGDLRDFHAGLEQLRLCDDNDAPLPTLLIRKYACLQDLAQAGVDALLSRHERKLNAARRRENDLRYEFDNLTSIIQDSHKAIERLRSDGSLLKAREQERILAEQNNRMASLREKMDDTDEQTALCESYDHTVAECERFFGYLDRAVMNVAVGRKLSADARGAMGRQITDRIDHLRGRINQLDPMRDESDESDEK